MDFGQKMRTAAGPPPFPAPKQGDAPFVTAKRKIPKDHPYDPKSLKPMAKMLWAMSISLGHALTAYRQFNRLKSVNVSPDGLLGGNGYVMPIPEMRKRLFEACEAISAISDTIHDEINAPHWKPRLAELDPNTAEDVERFVEEAADTLESPEEDAESDMEDIEKENDAKWHAKGITPEKDEPSSQIPTDGPGGQDHGDVFHGGWSEKQKEASGRLRGRQAHVIMLDEVGRWKAAETTLPVQFLPGGPRVDHIGPGEGRGPFGTFNEDGAAWEEDVDGHSALGWGGALGTSTMPFDPTPTDADDFGVGFGQRGEGAKGYGTRGPRGEVFGPASGLPDDPGGKVRDPSGDQSPSVDTHIPPTGNVWAAAVLPNDDLLPVARTDYFPGLNDHTTAQAELPGDESVPYNYDRDTPGVGQTFEHADNPYIKWDTTTKNYKPDPAYQRDLREEG